MVLIAATCFGLTEIAFVFDDSDGYLFRWFGLLFMVIVLLFCFVSVCGLFILQFDFVYFNGLVYLLIFVVICGFCWLVWLVVWCFLLLIEIWLYCVFAWFGLLLGCLLLFV